MLAIGLVLFVYLGLFLIRILWKDNLPPDDGGKKSLRVVKDNDPATSFFTEKIERSNTIILLDQVNLYVESS